MYIIISGCTGINMGSNRDTNQSDLIGSIMIDNSGSDTQVAYSFKNQSEQVVTVVGGVKYKLLKSNEVVDEGGVPIKDYIELEPGEDYTDIKTFSRLEPGSYTIQIEWNKTIVSTEFVKH
ncbi:hypothetical protein ACX1C1_00440 [Paenibacillus sp. strain BS8-2]